VRFAEVNLFGVSAFFNAQRPTVALRGVGPALLFGLRLWASVCLALYAAFWLELDNPQWAGTTAAIVCQPHLGASLRKGWFRMVGAVAIVVMTACFPQDRAAFFVSLALWGAACALVATLLRNFSAYAAALAGYTAAIIANDQLGAVGGLNGQAFMLAVFRTSEICIGSRIDLGSELDTALEALRRGDIALVTTHLGRLDDALAARPGAAALRTRGSILVLSEVLTQHAAYFEAGELA
jgi:uncharacterized membrane protein YccC